MTRKTFHTFLALTSVILLFSMAAICNFGTSEQEMDTGISESENSKTENKDASTKVNSDNNDKGSESSQQNDASDEQSDSGASQQGNNSQDKKDTSNQNNPPEIFAINVNSQDLFIGYQYTITADVADPDGDMLIYDWSTDGGDIDNPKAATVVWTTPMFPETYHITLDLSDGFGGNDIMTIAVRVEEEVYIIVEAPVMLDIVIDNPPPPYHTDTRYLIRSISEDPNNDLSHFAFNASSGTLSGQSGNTIYWQTPPDPGTYSITAFAFDKKGNEGSLTVEFFIEAKP